MKTMNLAFASVLVIASASCGHRERAPAPGSGSATPAASVVEDPTTPSPPTVNIASTLAVDAGFDALPGPATVIIAPTARSVDAALDGGPAAGAVNGTTNGTPTPDAF